MAIKKTGVVSIRGFVFDWILFPDLSGFFPKQEFNELFKCIENRHGVYYFFDNRSRIVSYLGCAPKQSIMVRIDQYRIERGTGNNFWINFHDQHTSSSFDDFKHHVQNLQLGTLSGTNLTGQQDSEAVIEAMESFLICKLQPVYSAPCHSGLTDKDQNLLMSALLEDAPGKRLKDLEPETDG